jgi:hypothetical protein
MYINTQNLSLRVHLQENKIQKIALKSYWGILKSVHWLASTRNLYFLHSEFISD